MADDSSVTAVYCCNDIYQLLPTTDRYPSVLENYIFPNLDVHTLFVIFASAENFADDPSRLEFRMCREEDPPLFTLTDCDNDDFLRWFMTESNIIERDAPSDEVELHEWTTDDLFRLMCRPNHFAVVIFSKDGYNTAVQLADGDDWMVDPRTNKLIGHLGRRDAPHCIRDPLNLLPVNEPRRAGEMLHDFLVRVRNQAFWEKRRRVFHRYVRLHGINQRRAHMVPDLFEPFVPDDARALNAAKTA